MKKQIISIAAPKAGSHIIANALQLAAARPWMKKRADQYASEKEILRAIPELPDRCWCHLPFTPKIHNAVRENFRVILFIRRHPLDIIVSHANYFELVSPHVAIDHQIIGHYLSEFPIRKRYEILIVLFEILYGVYTDWMDAEGVEQVLYEQLYHNRTKTMQRLYQLCFQNKVPTLPVPAMEIRSRMPVESAFRKGLIDDWTRELTPAQQQFAFEVMWDIIAEWGYGTPKD